MLQEMIARKLEIFYEETCSVLDYEITGAGANMRVEVVFSRPDLMAGQASVVNEERE